MQQADNQCHRPNAKNCVHAQKPYPTPAFSMNQAKSEEEEKREEETGKTEARRLMERKVAQQNKNTSEELKQGLRLPMHS